MQSEKITKSDEQRLRRYDDACGTAHALDLIGERWALLVIRELMLGPRRFSELTRRPARDQRQRADPAARPSSSGAGCPRASCRRRPRSRSMRRPTGGLRPSRSSRRSAAGRRARPRHDPTLPISAVSILLSLRTMIDPSAARGPRRRGSTSASATSYSPGSARRRDRRRPRRIDEAAT